jgi:hypothetical protein
VLLSGQSLVDRITRHFGGHGGHGAYCRPFADLTESQQRTLLARFPLENQELPALGVAPLAGPWLLVSTDHIAYADGSRRWVRRAADLGHVSRAAGQDASRQQDWSILELDFHNGVRERIQVESGKPYFGLWNALLLLARINRDGPVIGG